MVLFSYILLYHSEKDDIIDSHHLKRVFAMKIEKDAHHILKINLFTIATLSLFFSWLLAFPFYGPVLRALAPDEFLGVAGHQLSFVFICAHAITLFIGGLFIKNTAWWDKFLFLGAAAIVLCSLVFLLSYPLAWPVVWLTGMAIMGAASSFYILGWGVLFTFSPLSMGRMKTMALIIILSNVLLVVFNIASRYVDTTWLLILLILPLLGILGSIAFKPSLLHTWDEVPDTSPGKDLLSHSNIGTANPSKVTENPDAVTYLMQSKLDVSPTHPRLKEPTALPLSLLILFCLFVVGVFINGGFMYSIMLPAFDETLPRLGLFRFLPYLAVLLVIFKYGRKVELYTPVYAGITMLGLAFVFFALQGENWIGAALSVISVEAAFALMDLFVWVAMGTLAFIYLAPYVFFGIVGGVMVASVAVGYGVSSIFIEAGEAHRMTTAIFAAAAIIITFLIIPWLDRKMNRDFRLRQAFYLPGLPPTDPNAQKAMNMTMLSAYMEPGANNPGPVDSEQADMIHNKSEAEETLDKLLTKLLPGEKLTPREIEVTRLILQGYKNKEIAKRLHISDNTLKTHLKHIYPKFGVSQKRDILSLALNLKSSSDDGTIE